MTTTGDMIVAGGSGVPAALAIGASGYFLQSNGTTAGWAQTLGIANGGTGQTSANDALNALLPSQASANGKVLASDGTNTSWAAALTTTLASGSIFVGNVSNVATATPLTDIATLGTITTGVWNAGSVTSSSTLTATTNTTSPIVYGSASASGTLELQSTSHATKGAINFGASGAFGSISSAGAWTQGVSGLTGSHRLQGSSTKSLTGFGHVTIFDITTQSAGVGGMLTLSGYKASTSAEAAFAAISGYKENSGGGDEHGSLKFYVNDGSTLVDYGTISSAGAWTLGPTTGAALTAYVGSSGAKFAYDNASTYFTIFPGDANGTVDLKFGANSGSVPNLQIKNDGATVVGIVADSGAWTVGPSAGLGTAVGHTIYGPIVNALSSTYQRLSAASKDQSFIGVNIYLDSAAAAKRSVSSAAAYSYLQIDRSTSGTDPVFSFVSNSDSQTNGAAGASITTNQKTIGTASLAGAWALGPNVGDNLSTIHTFRSGDASTGSAGSRSVTIVRADCISGAPSTAALVVGNTANQAGMLHERGGQNYVWTRDVLNFVYTSDNTIQNPVSGMTDYLNLGSVSTAGAWTLGPTTGAALTAYVGSSGATFRYDSASTYLSLLPGDANGTVDIKFGANAGSAPNMQFKNDGGTVVAGINDDGTCVLGKTAGTGTFGTHYFYGGTSAGSGLVATCVKPTGADSASNYYLQFQTDTTIQGYIWNDGSGNLALATSSDVRLKENIRDADYGLSEIMALRPVKFDWKSGSAKDVKGFIAQDVLNVLPNSVSEGHDGFLNLGKDEFIPVMVRAIQELAEKLETALARIAALESPA
jgi:hypothetical protein